MQFTDLCLEPLDLRLEPGNLVGQRLDLPPLLVRLGLIVEGEPPEDIFKELEECVWPTQVGLIDLPVHGIGQLAGHRAPSPERKSVASREGVIYC
jgi:hypothetical protein